MSQRVLLGLLGANIGLTGYLLFDNRQKHQSTYEEMEARLDEVEGTLRGHIGLIEDSLKRIEQRQEGKKTTGGWGQGMSAEAEEMYMKRGKDDRGKQDVPPLKSHHMRNLDDLAKHCNPAIETAAQPHARPSPRMLDPEWICDKDPAYQTSLEKARELGQIPLPFQQIGPFTFQETRNLLDHDPFTVR